MRRMTQGPSVSWLRAQGAPSPLAASEVFLQEPSAQLLPLWLPASPWLPTETLLPQPLGWRDLPPHQVEVLINIRWAEKQRGEKIQTARASKEVPFSQYHSQASWHISLINLVLAVSLSGETWDKSPGSWVKGQTDAMSCCTSLPTYTGVPDHARHFVSLLPHSGFSTRTYAMALAVSLLSNLPYNHPRFWVLGG